ncbi:hypothetical protein BS17DRAFT_785944, partial [Gyrodon lividus]
PNLSGDFQWVGVWMGSWLWTHEVTFAGYTCGFDMYMHTWKLLNPGSFPEFPECPEGVGGVRNCGFSLCAAPLYEFGSLI